MKLRIMAMMVLAVVFCGIAAFGAEKDNPAIRSKKITLPKEEERPKYFVRNHFGHFKGTIESATPTRVKVKLPRGDTVTIPLFYFGAPPVHHVISKVAKIPRTVTDHQMEPGRRRLISVDASKLPLGKLKTWKNDGVLKGAFHSMNVVDPEVVDFQGRRGVKFALGAGKYADSAYQALASDFTVTDYLGYEAPFTCSVLVHYPQRKHMDSSSLITWGALIGDQQTWLNLGTPQIAGLGAIAGDEPPLGSDDWQCLTYSYTGGHDGTLTIYRNGEVLSTHQYDSKVERRPVTDITATTATLNGEYFCKSGSGSVTAYWGDIDHYNWFQMRHYHWEFSQNLNAIPAGKFNAKLTGLQPGTKYCYRYACYDLPKVDQGYGCKVRRWSYGPGVFVTAGEDGRTPGRNTKDETRQHFFIGCNRGVRWFMQSPGPTLWIDGVISKIDLYDYAMDFFEVRQSLGMDQAFKPSPAIGEELSEHDVTLSWKPGSKGVASYRVYFGIDKKAVEEGTVRPIDTREPTVEVKGMAPGAVQYWRVAQVDKDGKEIDKGDLWSCENTYGKAHTPRPQVGITVTPIRVLNWSGPIPTLKEQRLYIAKSPEELEAMGKPTYAPLVKRSKKEGVPPKFTTWLYPTMERLNPGKTIYWRVDFVQGDGRVTKGPVWHFKVRDYFTPEVDTVWAKPAFDHDTGGIGCKQSEERTGFPARSSASTPSKALLEDETIGFSRFLYKSRKLRDFQEFRKGCAKLGWIFEGGSYGGGYFSMAYGGFGGDPHAGEEIKGWNMVMHEFGHHLHCSSPAYADTFIARANKIFDNHKDNNIGLAGYGATNVGEDMAIVFHLMSLADGRDGYYRSNRPLYNLIREVMGGDRYIDLDPRKNLRTDAEAKLLSWGNAGGLIHYDGAKDVQAYEPVANTQGTFTPVGQAIESVQVGGVMGVKFDGKSALLWNERTKLALYDNRDFAGEFWVRKQPGSPDGVLAALTGKDGKSFQFKWSDFPGAREGAWQHLAYVYEGGGDTGDEAGMLRIYVGSKEVAATKQKHDLPHEASISVGGWVKNPEAPEVTEGFTGELGQIRIHSYDISRDQVEEHYAEEAAHYLRTPDAVAEKLYVDIDCRRYEDMPQHRHEPFHPDNLRKPWIRSWANFGTLGGRIHNDIDTFMWDYTGSTPMMRVVDGATVPLFQGKDRMVGGFMPNVEVVANPPRTLEVWIKRDRNENLVKDVKEVALEWGDFQLTDAMLEEAGVTADGRWRHVVIVFPEVTTAPLPAHYNVGDYVGNWAIDQKVEGKNDHEKRRKRDSLKREKTKEFQNAKKDLPEAEIFVDGKAAGKVPALLRPSEYNRLHLGAHYDFYFWNWRYFFNGAFSSVRVHKGALTPEQIQANAARKPQDEDKTVPVELVFDVNAETLPEGRLSEWKYTGSGGGTFKVGNPVSTDQPKTYVHDDGQVGLYVSKQPLTSSFDMPEGMQKNGPFTIIARVAHPWQMGGGGVPVLSWRGMSFAGTQRHVFSWAEQVEEDGKTKAVRKTLKPDRPTRHPYLEPLEGEMNPNAYMGYIWKTICLNYDGRTLRFIVDGKEELQTPANIGPGVPPRRGETPSLKFSIPGGGRRYTILNQMQVYDQSSSVKELERATAAVNPKPLKAKPIIALDFSRFKPDSYVKSVKNTGTLGGEFLSPDALPSAEVDRTPQIRTVDGVRSVWFDGTDDFLISDSPAPRTMTDNEPFTFEAFIKLQGGAHSALILALSNKGQGFGAGHDGLRLNGMLRQPRDGQRHHTRFRGKPGRWVHYVFVYEGTRKPSHVYVDGRLVDSVYWSAFFARPNDPMRIGAGYGGDIARMRMWRGLKSAEEIAALAEAALAKVVVEEAKRK